MSRKRVIIRPATIEVLFEAGKVGCEYCPYITKNTILGLNYCNLSRTLMDKDGKTVHFSCPIEFEKYDLEEE